MNKILWNFMNFWRILTHWHFINLFSVTNKIQPFQDFNFWDLNFRRKNFTKKTVKFYFLRFFLNWLKQVCLSVKAVFRKSKFLACRFFEIWPIKWPCSTFLRFWFFCSVRDWSILKFGKKFKLVLKSDKSYWMITKNYWSKKTSFHPSDDFFIFNFFQINLIVEKVQNTGKVHVVIFGRNSTRTTFSKALKMGHFRMNLWNCIFWGHFIFKGGETWC